LFIGPIFLSTDNTFMGSKSNR